MGCGWVMLLWGVLEATWMGILSYNDLRSPTDKQVHYLCPFWTSLVPIPRFRRNDMLGWPGWEILTRSLVHPAHATYSDCAIPTFWMHTWSTWQIAVAMSRSVLRPSQRSLSRISQPCMVRRSCWNGWDQSCKLILISVQTRLTCVIQLCYLLSCRFIHSCRVPKWSNAFLSLDRQGVISMLLWRSHIHRWVTSGYSSHTTIIELNGPQKSWAKNADLSSS